MVDYDREQDWLLKQKARLEKAKINYNAALCNVVDFLDHGQINDATLQLALAQEQLTKFEKLMDEIKLKPLLSNIKETRDLLISSETYSLKHLKNNNLDAREKLRTAKLSPIDGMLDEIVAFSKNYDFFKLKNVEEEEELFRPVQKKLEKSLKLIAAELKSEKIITAKIQGKIIKEDEVTLGLEDVLPALIEKLKNKVTENHLFSVLSIKDRYETRKQPGWLYGFLTLHSAIVTRYQNDNSLIINGLPDDKNAIIKEYLLKLRHGQERNELAKKIYEMGKGKEEGPALFRQAFIKKIFPYLDLDQLVIIINDMKKVEPENEILLITSNNLSCAIYQEITRRINYSPLTGEKIPDILRAFYSEIAKKLKALEPSNLNIAHSASNIIIAHELSSQLLSEKPSEEMIKAAISNITNSLYPAFPSASNKSPVKAPVSNEINTLKQKLTHFIKSFWDNVSNLSRNIFFKKSTFSAPLTDSNSANKHSTSTISEQVAPKILAPSSIASPQAQTKYQNSVFHPHTASPSSSGYRPASPIPPPDQTTSQPKPGG